MREILEHATCELQSSFRTLNARQFKRFNAEKWLISVKLLPKAEGQVITGAGGSLKSTTQPVSSINNLITWAIGPPGLQMDAKGTRNSGVTYKLKSYELIEDRSLACNTTTDNYHVLAQHLGIGEWLMRSVIAMEHTKPVTLDEPTFTSTITVKFSGNGSYSYAFLEGTGMLSLSGSYYMEEQLTISMVRIEGKPLLFPVVSLPYGQQFGDKKENKLFSESFALQDANQRLNILQLEEAIRGLDNNRQ